MLHEIIQYRVVPWWELSHDESCPMMRVVPWWELSPDESCPLMRVVPWWELSPDESCPLMRVVPWWELSPDESCPLMRGLTVSHDNSPVDWVLSHDLVTGEAGYCMIIMIIISVINDKWDNLQPRVLLNTHSHTTQVKIRCLWYNITNIWASETVHSHWFSWTCFNPELI